MANLGSFGAAVRELEPGADRDEFEFFGKTFTVEAAVPSVVLMKFCAGLVGQLSGIETDATMYELLRHALTKPAAKGGKPDASQWEKFYELAAGRKCASDDMITLVLAIAGAQAGKEREQSPTSADGSPPAGTSSSGSASDSPGSGKLVPVDEALAG